MARLPQSLTTVTLFSKILATIILVLIIPMASFYAGMQYEKAEMIGQFELPTAVTHSQEITAMAEKLVRDYLLKYTASNTLTSQRIQEFKLYHPQNLMESNNQLSFEMTYAVLPFSKSGNAFWLTGNGLLQQDGWIVGKKILLKAVKKNSLYQIISMTSLNL